MNIVTIKCTKQLIGEKLESFMHPSHVRVYSAKIHEFTTRKIRRIKSSRFSPIMNTQCQLKWWWWWSAWSTSKKHTAKIHLLINSVGIKMRYLCCSEAGCSRKSSSCSNNDSPRNQQSLIFGWKTNWRICAKLKIVLGFKILDSEFCWICLLLLLVTFCC